jgi:hypothetical protein
MYTTIDRHVNFDFVKEVAKALSPREIKDEWLNSLHNEDEKVKVHITLNDNGNIYFSLQMDGYVGKEVKEEVAEYVRQNDASEDYFDRLKKERASCYVATTQSLHGGNIKNGF